MDRCKEDIWDRYTYKTYRCARNAVKDGFCKQHHPDAVKARQEKSAKLYAEKREKDPLRIAYKEIDQLRAQLASAQAEKVELVKQLAEQIRECQRLNKLLELEDNQEVNK
jgi:hypothetical protein